MEPDRFPARKRLRLPDHDYRTPGVYFVTICTHGKECSLAHVHETYHELTKAGQIVLQCWHDLPQHFPRIARDSFIIMPNHVHGIVVTQLLETDDVLRSETVLDTSLSTVIGYFKSSSARRINLLRQTPGSPVWQRGFHDRVIRGERALAAIRDYVANNPVNWIHDRENPERSG